MGWSLSVDFGSSNTAAAMSRDGAVRPLQFRGRGPSMPSAVIWSPSGPLVGWSAQHRRMADPAHFVRDPKRLLTGLPDPVLVADMEVDPVDVVAAVLRGVWQEALAQQDRRPPDRVVLTHPVLWTPDQLRQLTAAAERAGMPSAALRFVLEPVAAAEHYAAAGEAVPVGSSVAVFDFGGGTCDVALLERTGEQEYRVVDFDGDPHLGGNDFDGLIRDWALAELQERGRQDLIAELSADTESGLRTALNLRDEIRDAKETLSSQRQIGVLVAGVGRAEELVLTRGQYEEMIRPQVERGVGLLTRLLQRTGITPGKLYLTGGSSQTPAVHRAITEATGITPATLDDPKLVVAEGALQGLRESTTTETATIGTQTPETRTPETPTKTGPLPALTSATFGSALAARTAVILFDSVGSGPSAALPSQLAALAARRSDVMFGVVDVEQEPGLAARYRVQHPPAIVGFRRGTQAGLLEGPTDATRIAAFVDEVRRRPQRRTTRIVVGAAGALAVLTTAIVLALTLIRWPPPPQPTTTPVAAQQPHPASPDAATSSPTPEHTFTARHAAGASDPAAPPEQDQPSAISSAPPADQASSPPSSAPAPEGGLSTAEQQLFDAVPDGLVKACSSNSPPTEQLASAKVGIDCSPWPKTDGAENVFEVDVMRVESTGRAVGQIVTSTWSDDCSTKVPSGTFDAGGTHVGSVGCGTSQEGYPLIAWSFDSKGIVILAFGDKGKKTSDLAAFWDATPVP